MVAAGDVRAARAASDFFFSSRRRHTSCGRDWSSDVCSSDLWFLGVVPALLVARHFGSPGAAVVRHSLLSPEGIAIAAGLALAAALILLATVWAPTLRIGGM